MLTRDQLLRFATDGYVVVPDVVPEALLAACDAEIDRVLAGAPPPAGTAGPHFVFAPPAELPAADAALRSSPALRLAGELVAPRPIGFAFDQIQIALDIPPFPHRPGVPHIDGHRPGQEISSFTMLAAILLSDESVPDRGNLWVWPGSHLGHQRLLVERGVDALVPVSGQAALLEPPVFFGRGEPLLARRGDLLLAHFLLGHNTGGNTSEQTRRILYYRLACDGHRDRWADTFRDAFTEYPVLHPPGGV